MSIFHWMVGAAIALVGLGLATAIADMISEEMRSRLDGLPHLALTIFVLLLRPDQRRLRLAEGRAELHEVLRGAEARPVTRLFKGLKYAAGWAWASVRMRNIPVSASAPADDRKVVVLHVKYNDTTLIRMSEAGKVALTPVVEEHLRMNGFRPGIDVVMWQTDGPIDLAPDFGAD